MNFIADRTGRFELVDGQIIAVAGASRRRDLIVCSAIRLISNALVGHPCEPFTAETFIRIPAGNVRQPDFGIQCASPQEDSLFAEQPRLVAEVLTEGSSEAVILDKFMDYQSVPSVGIILFISSNRPEIRIYRRTPVGEWSKLQKSTGLEASINLPEWDLVLALADLYSGCAFGRADAGNGVNGLGYPQAVVIPEAQV